MHLLQTSKDVPVQSRWVKTFEIPTVFTMKAIQKGVLTKPARVEMTNALYSRMIQHNTRPTPFEYKTACSRLIAWHSTMKDKTAKTLPCLPTNGVLWRRNLPPLPSCHLSTTVKNTWMLEKMLVLFSLILVKRSILCLTPTPEQNLTTWN